MPGAICVIENPSARASEVMNKNGSSSNFVIRLEEGRGRVEKNIKPPKRLYVLQIFESMR
jgi:hypothetical protein